LTFTGTCKEVTGTRGGGTRAMLVAVELATRGYAEEWGIKGDSTAWKLVPLVDGARLIPVTHPVNAE